MIPFPAHDAIGECVLLLIADYSVHCRLTEYRFAVLPGSELLESEILHGVSGEFSLSPQRAVVFDGPTAR